MPSGTRSTGHRREKAEAGTVVSPDDPVILHANLPGRLRIHLPGWSVAEREMIERRLCMIPAVRQAVASPETGNVLLLYDPALTDPRRLLQAARRAVAPRTPRSKPVKRSRSGGSDRPSAPSSSADIRPTRYVRAVLLNVPAVLALLISILTCGTPLGAARVGLEAVQLAMQIAASAT
jgi:hypothetical protein